MVGQRGGQQGERRHALRLRRRGFERDEPAERGADQRDAVESEDVEHRSDVLGRPVRRSIDEARLPEAA